MKISKITLQWLVYHALRSDTAGHAELNLIEEISEALKEDELEIEGYEKSEWVKFDMNDPKTFPPHRKVVVVATKDGRVGTSEVGIDTTYNECGFVGYYRDEVTHWRAAPVPPANK